jgi:NADPH:quinone reductase-like Zn-dependent oxidoreductase
MRAIVIGGFGSVEHHLIKEIPDPEPKPGHAVIEVKAFGINHAEMYMRRGEWAEGPDLSSRIPEPKRIDAVLDLVGNSTILDSLTLLRRGGRA